MSTHHYQTKKRKFFRNLCLTILILSIRLYNHITIPEVDRIANLKHFTYALFLTSQIEFIKYV